MSNSINNYKNPKGFYIFCLQKFMNHDILLIIFVNYLSRGTMSKSLEEQLYDAYKSNNRDSFRNLLEQGASLEKPITISFSGRFGMYETEETSTIKKMCSYGNFVNSIWAIKLALPHVQDKAFVIDKALEYILKDQEVTNIIKDALTIIDPNNAEIQQVLAKGLYKAAELKNVDLFKSFLSHYQDQDQKIEYISGIHWGQPDFSTGSVMQALCNDFNNNAEMILLAVQSGKLGDMDAALQSSYKNQGNKVSQQIIDIIEDKPTATLAVSNRDEIQQIETAIVDIKLDTNKNDNPLVKARELLLAEKFDLEEFESVISDLVSEDIYPILSQCKMAYKLNMQIDFFHGETIRAIEDKLALNPIDPNILPTPQSTNNSNDLSQSVVTETITQEEIATTTVRSTPNNNHLKNQIGKLFELIGNFTLALDKARKIVSDENGFNKEDCKSLIDSKELNGSAVFWQLYSYDSGHLFNNVEQIKSSKKSTLEGIDTAESNITKALSTLSSYDTPPSKNQLTLDVGLTPLNNNIYQYIFEVYGQDSDLYNN